VQQPILLSWSGGKDSAMALYEIQRAGEFQVASLLTNINTAYDRISMHGVRRELLERQACALGLPLHTISLSQNCNNQEYESKSAAALAQFQMAQIQTVAFGDIFLEDLRQYRERNLAQISMKGIFPIWLRDTRELARTFIELGFRAILVCVDTEKLPESFAGRQFDADLLNDLPAEVDPCGENGEFHTFVYDGPVLKNSVAFTFGERVVRDRFAFCDLLAP
jgi:uncharacterized protein (TIGR00290 family)